MAALRCTGKLLKRLGIRNPGEPPPPTNRLGDWFANIIYTRQGHFVLRAVCSGYRESLGVRG